MYSKFGLSGHDGDDWIMPEMTPLFSPLTGKVIKHGNDVDGWGIFVQVWDSMQNLIVNITHCTALLAITGGEVRAGQKIAYSGNTGFSSAPHVHVAVADTDASGNRLNQNNGYKGWYSILDAGKINLVALPAEGVTGTITTPTTTMTFDEIFAKYYAGWPRTEAEADFQQTYGGDLAKLRIARGESPSGTTAVRPKELEKIYYLIPAFNGLSLIQISSGIPLGRVDILAGFLGIDQNTKLLGGQALNLINFPTDYFPNSSEWLGFKKLVGLTPVGTPGNYYIKPELAGKDLNTINKEGGSTFRSDVMATFLAISEYYKIPAYQGFGTGGFPAQYIPNSSEWQGFIKIFTQTAPIQTKPPIDVPLEPLPEVIYTNPPDTGEGLTPVEIPPIEEIPPVEIPPVEEIIPDVVPPVENIIPEGSIALILSKLDQILDKITTGIAPILTPVPPAEEATGGLFVNSTPARAAIYLNDTFQFDYTPSNSTYQMARGVYRLRLKKTGYKPFEQDVTIEEGLTSNVNAQLEALTP